VLQTSKAIDGEAESAGAAADDDETTSRLVELPAAEQLLLPNSRVLAAVQVSCGRQQHPAACWNCCVGCLRAAVLSRSGQG
jgi:hypothetical protein